MGTPMLWQGKPLMRFGKPALGPGCCCVGSCIDSWTKAKEYGNQYMHLVLSGGRSLETTPLCEDEIQDFAGLSGTWIIAPNSDYYENWFPPYNNLYSFFDEEVFANSYLIGILASRSCGNLDGGWAYKRVGTWDFSLYLMCHPQEQRWYYAMHARFKEARPFHVRYACNYIQTAQLANFVVANTGAISLELIGDLPVSDVVDWEDLPQLDCEGTVISYDITLTNNPLP